MWDLVYGRIEQADKNLLVKVCNSRREDVSDFVGRTVIAEVAKPSGPPGLEERARGVSPAKPDRQRFDQ